MPPLFYLWIAFALNYIDRQMVYSMFPALERDLGFSAVGLAWAGTIFIWTYTPLLPIAGAMADRMRRDRLIVLSLVLWSASTILCGLAPSAWMFLAGRAAMGVTEALYYPAAMALLATYYPAAKRSRVLGIHQSAQLTGGLIGTWYGGWAADHTGWRSAFLLAGAAGVVFSPILRRGLPESIPQGVASGERVSARQLLRSRMFVLLCAAFAGYASIQWMFFAWFPTYLQSTFSLSMTESGRLSSLFVQGTFIVGILGGGFLADRLRRFHPRAPMLVTAAGAFFCSPFAYLAFSSKNLNECLALSAGFGLFAGCLTANVFASAFDILDDRLRGAAAGWLNMCGGASAGGIVLVAGLVKNTWGFAPLLMGAMVVTMVLSALLAVLARRRAHPIAAVAA